MSRRLWGFAVIWILIAAACAPAPQLRNDALFSDTSLTSGEPCFAPCWRNLLPGETAWDEAQNIVGAMDDVTNFTRGSRNRDTGEEVYDFHYQDGPQCCRIYTRDGNTLASILVLLTPEIAVGDVVDHYGEPQYIYGEDKTDDQSFITLVYPDVPMLIYAFAAGLKSGEIGAESEVIGTIYMAPSEMSLFLSDPQTKLFSWQGYGALSELLGGEAVIPASNAGNGADE